MATVGVSMQWSQWMVEDDLVVLLDVVDCSSAAGGWLAVKSFTLF